MDNKKWLLTKDRYTNQLKKHVLAVSTCKIHRLKTNSASFTALSMVKCPYPGRSLFMKKGRLRVCMCVIYMDVDIYTCIARDIFRQTWGDCVYR